MVNWFAQTVQKFARFPFKLYSNPKFHICFSHNILFLTKASSLSKLAMLSAISCTSPLVMTGVRTFAIKPFR